MKALAAHEDGRRVVADAKASYNVAARGLCLDALFINAGAAKFAAFPDGDETLWDQIADGGMSQL